MKELKALIKRNSKLFFKDKGLFFTSLITPMILLVLYATFLANIYRDSFLQGLGPASSLVSDKLIDGLVGGQLFASLLAVSCITVSFCSNMLMVQDKANGTLSDLLITPVKRSTLAISYYVSTTISTLLICYSACLVSFIYLAIVGWFMSVLDVILVLIDVFILVSFGTALSSVINFFLSSQGQISAVGSIVSSVYGFICGAYMPISSFGKGLQTALSFLPGTYGTGLIKNHALNGAINELSDLGVPNDAIKGLKDAIDCNLYFFDNGVKPWVMLLIMIVSIAILLVVYVLLNKYCLKGAKKQNKVAK